jgi:DNA polymerase zeta
VIILQKNISELASECNNDSTASSSLLIGRLILQVWWLVRKERPLHSYNFGNVVKEILNMKFSELDGIYLAQLFASDEIGLRSFYILIFSTYGIFYRSTLLKYFLRKSFINLHLLAHLDLFVRTCQMAQVYGIQFEGVLTRGSQFRVESMLLRLAIQRKLFAPSVNIDQRAK